MSNNIRLIINSSPRSGQAWFAKGICAEHYQNLEVALSYYQNALKFQPINLTYLERKFILELELRQIVASKSTLAKIKFIDPQFLKINELNLMLKNFTN